MYSEQTANSEHTKYLLRVTVFTVVLPRTLFFCSVIWTKLGLYLVKTWTLLGLNKD